MRQSWIPAVIIAVWLCTPGCSGQKATTPVVPLPGSGGPGQPAETAGAWTTDLAQMRFPDRPAAGKVHGQDFAPDQVKLEAGVLTFRQGKDFFADREIKLHLFGEPEALAKGLTLEVRPDAEFSATVPQVELAWKEAGGNLPQTEMFMSRYAMKLEVGPFTGGKLPGKIYVSLPDQAHSFLAGTFAADAPDLTGAKIHGKIALKGAEDYKLAVGYVGSTTSGAMKSGSAGTSVSPGKGGSGSVSSFGTHLAFDQAGCTFRHLGMQPGTYLVFATWNEQYADGKWVNIRDQKDLTVDLSVDPDALGTLAVQLPAGSKERTVRLLPLDAGGKLPATKLQPEGLAFQLQAFVKGLGAEAKAGQDSVQFTGLRAGSYRVLLGRTALDVVVKAKETAKVELPATP